MVVLHYLETQVHISSAHTTVIPAHLLVNNVFIYLVGTMFSPIQAEFRHRDGHPDSWNAGGQHCPHRLAIIILKSEQIIYADKGVGTGDLGRWSRGSDFMGSVNTPVTTGRNLRLNVDGVQKVMLSGSRDPLTDDLVFADQILLQIPTVQCWKWAKVKGRIRPHTQNKTSVLANVDWLLITCLSCTDSLVHLPSVPSW